MADSLASGAKLAQQSRRDHAIERVPTAVAVFVGRTLKGPVNEPVRVSSFSGYQQQFGGLWQPAPLSYSVEQFFENGGREAYIVRIVNGARPPTLTLPAGRSALRLAARNPGSREYLRASVDYDGLGSADGRLFNLVVQRVRAAASELVEEQEIFRRLSVEPGATRFVGTVLAESRLAHLAGEVPAQRPDRSARGPGGVAIGYTLSNPDGDDGAPLTDYDVIGCAASRSGLFALGAVPQFNLLCIPPLTRERDVGLSTLLVAARVCRERQALLLLDPPAAWSTATLALEALRSWPFRSESAAMYFPRVQALDRLRGRMETFASCGVAAGMMARMDETWPVWTAAESEETILRPGLKPAAAVSDADRARLAQAGVNTLLSVRSGARGTPSPRTLAPGGAGASADWKYLSARRLALFIAASIERGTRWVLQEHNGPATRSRAGEQVQEFLQGLAQAGAFAGAEAREMYFVVSDERVNRADAVAQGKINLLFGFAVSRPGEFDTWLLTHQPGASRVRPVTVNRAATARQRVEWEIETAILRG